MFATPVGHRCEGCGFAGFVILDEREHGHNPGESYEVAAPCPECVIGLAHDAVIGFWSKHPNPASVEYHGGRVLPPARRTA